MSTDASGVVAVMSTPVAAIYEEATFKAKEDKAESMPANCEAVATLKVTVTFTRLAVRTKARAFAEESSVKSAVIKSAN